MKKYLALSILFALAPSMASAFWFGDPGRVLGNGSSGISAIYDNGTRDIKSKSGSSVVGLDNSRLYAQYAHGMENGVELFGRLLPNTGSLDLDNSSFNPTVWGLGGGVHWVPPHQGGPVTWGLQTSVDWNMGSDSGTDIRYSEIVLNGGISYPVHPQADLYGGASLIFDDIRIKSNSGTASLKNDDNFGLFGGIGFRPAPDWTLGFEFHVINEQVIGIMGRYSFGSGSMSSSRSRSSSGSARTRKRR